MPVSAIDFLNSCVSFSSAFLGMILDSREHFQSIIDEVARRPWGPDDCFNFGSAVNMRVQALLDELCDTTPNHSDDLCEQLGQDDDLSGLHSNRNVALLPPLGTLR